MRVNGTQRSRATHIMIFGFNTDAKVGDTVYHVQSEARVNDLLLQTQVFVQGQCIGKRASSYAERSLKPDFKADEMHELLKQQHRLVLEAVREERAQDIFCSDGEVQDINAGGLSIRWLNSDQIFDSSPALLNLQVLLHHTPIDGALVTARLEFKAEAHIHSQAMSEENGLTVLEIDLPADNAAETAVLIRGKTDEKSVTRKFRVKRA